MQDHASLSWARYHGFANFLADMGERPEDQTLDRIDVNGHYEPGNCRWATIWEQSRNKRTSKTTPEQVREVLRRWQSGERAGQIVEALGLSKATVSNIIKGKAFRDLTGLEPTDHRMESPTRPEWTPWAGWHSQVLRELARRGMMQKDLAEAVGCTPGGLSSLLRGQIKQTEFVLRINEALGLRQDDADPTESPKERRTFGKTKGWTGTIRVFVGDGWRERTRREMRGARTHTGIAGRGVRPVCNDYRPSTGRARRESERLAVHRVCAGAHYRPPRGLHGSDLTGHRLNLTTTSPRSRGHQSGRPVGNVSP